jgi:hypothetical protein
MTLIAIHADKDSATTLTDTLSYTPGARDLGHCSKVRTLPHLDAAVLHQGNSLMGTWWDTQAAVLANFAPDFDALVHATPGAMRDLWKALPSKHTHEESTAFVVGYSAERESFAAYLFTHEDDFEPFFIGGTFMHPMPVIFRPSHVEARRLAPYLEPERMAEWNARRPCVVPQSREEWIELGQIARTRATATEAKVLIGGFLHLTTLEQGSVCTETVHTYDDQGEEFAKMMAGTLHPVGQLGACFCGSGKVGIDCCYLGPEEPCMCESGKAFGDCCRVDTKAPVDA